MNKFAKGATSQKLDRIAFDLFGKLRKDLGVIGVEVHGQDVTPSFVLLDSDTANSRLVQQAERISSFQILNFFLGGHHALLLERIRLRPT
jgi:hypothetical protein